MGTNVTTAYITCPVNEKETLGIKLPFLVMIIKNVYLTTNSAKKIFYFWGASPRRQERKEEIQSLQLSVDY